MLRPHSTVMALGLILLLGTASAQADLISVRANVPFSFKVGETTLPSGDYAFRLDAAELPNVLSVRSQSGHGGALIMTLKVDTPEDQGDRPKLVFNKDGGEYVLAQVLDPGHYGLKVLSARPRGEPKQVVLLAN
jgi:hypothetical protein